MCWLRNSRHFVFSTYVAVFTFGQLVCNPVLLAKASFAAEAPLQMSKSTSPLVVLSLSNRQLDVGLLIRLLQQPNFLTQYDSSQDRLIKVPDDHVKAIEYQLSKLCASQRAAAGLQSADRGTAIDQEYKKFADASLRLANLSCANEVYNWLKPNERQVESVWSVAPDLATLSRACRFNSDFNAFTRLAFEYIVLGKGLAQVKFNDLCHSGNLNLRFLYRPYDGIEYTYILNLLGSHELVYRYYQFSDAVWKRRKAELKHFFETPEGQSALERTRLIDMLIQKRHLELWNEDLKQRGLTEEN